MVRVMAWPGVRRPEPGPALDRRGQCDTQVRLRGDRLDRGAGGALHPHRSDRGEEEIVLRWLSPAAC